MSEDKIQQLVEQLDRNEIDASEYQRRLTELLEQAGEEAKASPDEPLRKSRIRSSARMARKL